MKSFFVACVAAVIVACGAWIVLDRLQEPVSVAFTATGVRI